VGDVKGHRAPIGERHPAVFLVLGSGQLEDCVEMVAGHGPFYREAGRASMLLVRSMHEMATDADGTARAPSARATDGLDSARSPSARAIDGLDSARSPSARASDIVVLEDVRKTYGEEDVLKGINMVCRRNETTCIVGGSGAGKTTLLRLIVALDKPTSGRIYIDGEDTVPLGERELNRVRMKFGMVYQYAALLDSFTVLENVAFPLVEHTRQTRKEIRKRVMDKLSALGLEESVLAKHPAELSGGMRKRVGLARALMLDPPIVVYDEPTSGLDPLTSRAVDELIDEARRRFGVTSIVITHDIASCFRIADQAILLNRGEVVARGSPPDLAHGDNEVAQEFIRKSRVDVDAIWRERKEAAP
jgi:phospholipid/cholesterol/gamma-HCH transport system ATP-binding protein